MNFHSFVAEFVKLAVSEEQARRSLDRLDQLEQSKPSGSQVLRYAGIGAAAAPAVGALASTLAGKPYVHPGGSLGRVLAADAAKGAITAGAIPLVNRALDQRAEKGTLRQFMREQGS